MSSAIQRVQPSPMRNVVLILGCLFAVATFFAVTVGPVSGTLLQGKLGMMPVVSPSEVPTPSIKAADAMLGARPITFLKNMGQWPDDIRYQTSSQGTAVRLLDQGLSFAVAREVTSETEEKPADDVDPSEESEVYETLVWNLLFQNANPQTTLVATDEHPSPTHFLKGNDPKKWITNTPEAAAITYTDLYPGIDVKFYGVGTDMKYDIIAQPGASLADVRLGFEGIKSLGITTDGALEVTHAWGTYTDLSPISYQMINGQRSPVTVRYRLLDPTTFGFEIVGPYDTKLPVIIDPMTLQWSTFMGGTFPGDIAIDSNRDVYITGSTYGSFPTTPGAYQPTYVGGSLDYFVTKIKSDGTDVEYSTYLGGTAWDLGSAIAVNAAGEAYVVGQTRSRDFPTTPGAFEPTFTGYAAGTITKLNASGSALIYSTYLGGPDSAGGNDIAINAAGEAYIIGGTNAGFPTTPGAYQTTYGGGTYDAFVTKLNAFGSALIYSTYLGGSFDDRIYSIEINTAGEAYVTGGTGSPNFPTTPGAYQTTYGGGSGDAHIAKLNAFGSALIYSTYLGGSSGESSLDIAINTAGEAYVTGGTRSTDFPTTPGAYQITFGGGVRDGFVTKLNSDGTDVEYSTYLGGSNDGMANLATSEAGTDIAINAAGEAYVVGQTRSTDFPITPGAYQVTNAGSSDFFMTHISADGGRIASDGSTYLGGSRDEYGNTDRPSAVLDPTETYLYITGPTESADFPIQDRFGVRGADADVYRSVKLYPIEYREPVVITMCVGDDGAEDASPNVWTATGNMLPDPDLWNGRFTNPSYAYDIIAVGTTLYTGSMTQGNVYKSTDSGATWTNTGDLINTERVFSLHELNGKLYAGTGSNGNGGVYRSDNDGATWVRTANLAPNPVNVYDIVSIGTTLFAGVTEGDTFFGRVYKSTNEGASWERVGTTNLDTHVWTLHVHEGKLFAGTMYGANVYLLEADGVTWTRKASFEEPIGSGMGRVYSFATDRCGVLYAGTYGEGDIPGRVYKSINDGQDWTLTSPLPGATVVESLAAIDGVLYAGTGYNGDVFKSIDQGATWIPTGNVVLPGVPDLEVSNATEFALIGNTLFISTGSQTPVFKTTHASRR